MFRHRCGARIKETAIMARKHSKTGSKKLRTKKRRKHFKTSIKKLRRPTRKKRNSTTKKHIKLPDAVLDDDDGVDLIDAVLEATVFEAAKHFQTGIKKNGRGRAQKSVDLIQAMYEFAKAAQPITGRGVGYKLFVAMLIASMSRNEMQKVYRLLKEAREEGKIPWDWIVDETREAERVSTWANPAEYAEAVAYSYRRDFWEQQPVRVEIWSEKARSAACSHRCSTSSELRSASVTGLAARLSFTLSHKITTVAR
jgi:hypothetical protein